MESRKTVLTSRVQGSKRGTENRPADSAGEGEVGMSEKAALEHVSYHM